MLFVTGLNSKLQTALTLLDAYTPSPCSPARPMSCNRQECAPERCVPNAVCPLLMLVMAARLLLLPGCSSSCPEPNQPWIQ